jgi:hypothetical protein
MSNNLLTEVSRISEIIYGTTKSLLNEGLIGNAFKNIAEAEIQKIIRAEIKNAIKAGAKNAKEAGKNSAKNIESKVLKKTGLTELTGPQISALRTESATIAKEETEAAAEAAAKLATSTGAKAGTSTVAKAGTSKGAKAGTVVSKGSSQNVNKMVQNLTINLGNDVKAAIKGPVSKAAKTTRGATKKLRTTKKVTEAEIKVIDDAVKTGAKEELEQGIKQGWSWATASKWAAGIGLGLGALWLLYYFMSSEDVPVPDDIPVEPPVDPVVNPKKYRDCENEPVQTFGCKSSLIRQIQDCLGVVIDGIWGPKTNTALVANAPKFAAGFTKDDIKEICASSSGKIVDKTTEREKIIDPQDVGGELASSNTDNSSTTGGQSSPTNKSSFTTGGFDPNSMD